MLEIACWELNKRCCEHAHGWHIKFALSKLCSACCVTSSFNKLVESAAYMPRRNGIHTLHITQKTEESP